MTTREQLLGLFEENRGVYFSGEELAQRLDLSRTAVWKAVSTLRSEGYPIDAVRSRGYCLPAQADILSVQGIEKYLDQPLPSLQVLDQTASTNAVLRRRAAEGAPQWEVTAAREQTAGRGRQGREFFSPPDTGVYLSILLRPRQWTPQQAVRLTTMAAVAMCRAIESVSDEKPGIKWVNDIFVRGKKVCGILTEGAFDMESGLLEYAVLGTGVNVFWPREGFPAELEQIAGAVFREPEDDVKNRLTAAFLNTFRRLYDGGEDYIDAYRSYSLVIGREITVHSAEGDRSALGLGIDRDCRLQVRYETGETESLSYGEISIRL